MNDNIHNKHPSETKMPKITNAPPEMISPHWIVCLLYSKGGLISEKNHFGSNLPKEWCQITPVSDFQLRTRCLREWFDTVFFGIWAKVIIFLRLSHLYYAYNSMVWNHFWRSIWIFAMLLFEGFFWRIYVKKIKKRS